jgi:hypothetical protein
MTNAINGTSPKIAFFHQNEPDGNQGGVERYLSTILSGNPDSSLLVTETSKVERLQRITVTVSNNSYMPKGMRYLHALLRDRKRIKSVLSKANVTALGRNYSFLLFFLSSERHLRYTGWGRQRESF